MGKLPDRICYHPELFLHWNDPRAGKIKPAKMIYHCECGANYSCPVCGYGAGQWPCDCRPIKYIEAEQHQIKYIEAEQHQKMLDRSMNEYGHISKAQKMDESNSDFIKFSNALRALFIEICKALYIDRIVDWLKKRLR